MSEKKPIFKDPTLEAEHQALHTMACVLAEKWKLSLEDKDCSFSYEGFLNYYEYEIEADMSAFMILVNGHKARIQEYREKQNRGEA